MSACGAENDLFDRLLGVEGKDEVMRLNILITTVSC